MIQQLQVLPFFNNENDTPKTLVWKQGVQQRQSEQYFPLLLKKTSDNIAYLLPYEPFIDITGGHTIIKRQVAKPFKNTKGTIKERWNSKDYNITIRGVLMGSLLTGSVKECYPIKDFEKLKDYFQCGESIKVYSEPLNMLNILNVVIESISFPFTKGENVQAYEIKAFSDNKTEALRLIEDTII